MKGLKLKLFRQVDSQVNFIAEITVFFICKLVSKPVSTKQKSVSQPVENLDCLSDCRAAPVIARSLTYSGEDSLQIPTKQVLSSVLTSTRLLRPQNVFCVKRRKVPFKIQCSKSFERSISGFPRRKWHENSTSEDSRP
jgi:uncharacterized membrane protein